MAAEELNKQIDEVRARVSRMLEARDPSEPIGAKVVFKVKKDSEKQFEKSANELTTATRALAGCKLFTFIPAHHEDPSEPQVVEYWIFEDWLNVRLFRSQWDSAHLKKFQYAVPPLLAALPELTFLEPVEGEGTGGGVGAGIGTATAGRWQVAQTGQSRCWDKEGKKIGCGGTGQDGQFKAGDAPPSPRFTDNKDGTVTDEMTGLSWLQNANMFGEVPWYEAVLMVRQLASGGGLKDGSKAGTWRLPNVNELQSLLSLNNSYGPAIASDHPFTNLQAANYWSSTSVAAFPALAWYTAMAVGPPVFDLKFNGMRIWPVKGRSTKVPRTGQKLCWDTSLPPKVIPGAGTGQDGELQEGREWPDPRFTDRGDGTVRDNLTGLIWLKNATPFGTRNWEQALADCNSLADGMHGLKDGSRPRDWRMPNVNELRSLEDYGAFQPALPNEGKDFTNVRQSLCWSSTTVASAPNLARFLFVGIGSCVWDHKGVVMGVWPVKGP